MKNKYTSGSGSGVDTDKTLDLRKAKVPMQNKWIFPEPQPVSSADLLDDEDDVEDEYKKMFLRDKQKREESKREMTEREIANRGEEALICLKKGSLMKALEIYENSLLSLAIIKGVESAEYRRYFEIVVGILNKYAMKHLEKNNIEKSLNILFECEDLTKLSKAKASYSPGLRAQTFMNLGNVYRHISRPKKALRFFDEALKIILNHKLEEMAGAAYLNLCTIFSKLASHTKAMQYAKNALIFSQNDLLNYLQNKGVAKSQKKFEQKINLVATALHNMGVEQEFLHHYEKALDWYRKSFEFVESKLGSEAEMTKNFKKIYEDAKGKLVRKIFLNKNTEKPFDNPMNLAKKAVELRSRPKSATQRKKYDTDTDTPNQEKKLLAQAQQTSKTDTNVNFYFEGTKIRKKPYPESTINRLTPNTFTAVNFKKSMRPASALDQDLRETVKATASKGNHKYLVKERKDNTRIEMIELERMGILDWEEDQGDLKSEGSDEDMLDFQQQRAHFLQRLNRLGDDKRFSRGDPLDAYFEDQREERTDIKLKASKEKGKGGLKEEKTLKRSKNGEIKEVNLATEQSSESFEESQILNIDELMRNLNGVKGLLKKTKNQELQTDDFMLLDPEPDPNAGLRRKASMASIGVAPPLMGLSEGAQQLIEDGARIENDDENAEKEEDSMTDTFIFDRNKRVDELRALRARMNEMNKSAKVIQRHYRRCLERQRFKDLKGKVIRDHHLVYQRVVNLHPNDGTAEFLTIFYILRIYLSVSRRSLNWVLKSLESKKKSFEVFLDVDVKVEMERKNQLSSETLRSLRDFIEERKNFMYICNNNSIEFRDKDPKAPLHGMDSLDNSHIDYFSEGGDKDRGSLKFVEESHYIHCVFKIQRFVKQYIIKRHVQNEKERVLELLFKCIRCVQKGVYIELRCFMKREPFEREAPNSYLITGVVYSTDKTKRLSPLVFPKALLNHYGKKISRRNIFEIVRVDLKKSSILLTEEADYWLEMDERQKKKQKQVVPTIKDKHVLLIQKSFRGFMQRKKFEAIIKWKKRAGPLSEFGRRYVLNLKYPYLIGIYFDTKYKNILIKVIKKPPEEIVVEHKQKLYEQFESNDLKRYCLIILKEAKLVRIGENQIKVLSRRIEQVKAERGSDVRRSKEMMREDDLDIVKKDPLFETKLEEAWIRINIALQKEPFSYERVLNQEEEQRDLPERQEFEENGEENSDHRPKRAAKIIQKNYRAYRSRAIINRLIERRPVERNRFPTYREFYKIDLLQMTRAKNLAEQIQQKMMESNNMVFVGKENHSFKDGTQCLVAVYFHEEFQSLIIETKLKSSEKVKQICIPLPVLGFSEFNRYIKDDLKNLILARLRLSGEEVFFQYDPKKLGAMEKLVTLRPPEEQKTIKFERKSTLQVSHSRGHSQSLITNVVFAPESIKGSKLDLSNLARKKSKSSKGGVTFKSEDAVEVPVINLVKQIEADNYLLEYFIKIGLSNELHVNCKSIDHVEEDITVEILNFERDLNDFSEEIKKVIRKQIKQYLKKVEGKKKPVDQEKNDLILPFLAKDIPTINFNKEGRSLTPDYNSVGLYSHLLEQAIKSESSVAKIQNFFRGKIFKRKFKEQSEKNEKANIYLNRRCLHIGNNYVELRFFFNKEENVIVLNTVNLNSSAEERRKGNKFWALKLDEFLPKVAKLLKETRPSKKTNALISKEIGRSLSSLISDELSIKVVNEVIRVNSKRGFQIKEIDQARENELNFSRSEIKIAPMTLTTQKTDSNKWGRAGTDTGKAGNPVDEKIAKTIFIQKFFKRMVAQKQYRALRELSSKAVRVFLRTEVKCTSQNYFLVNYHYLIKKAQIAIYLVNLNKGKRIVKGYLLELKSLSEDVLKHIQKEQAARRIYTVEYRNLLNPVVDYTRKNLSVDLVQNELWVSFLDPSVSLGQIPSRDIQRMNIDTNTSKKRKKLMLDAVVSVVAIQRFFRRKRAQHLSQLKKDGGKLKESATKRYGHLVKKIIKNIGGTYYSLVIYRKDDQLLTIIALDMDSKENKLKFSYNIEQNSLINTGGLPLEDFLIQNLVVVSGQLRLNDLNREVVLDRGSPDREVLKKVQQAFLDKEGSPKETKQENPLQVFEKLDEELMTQNEKDEEDVVIIHQKTEKINDDTKCLFNVYYNEQGSRGAGKKLDNIVQIEVDLKDLRQQNPMLNLSTPDSLRNLAEDLTKAIKVGSSGEIVVDSSKVDPRCLSLKEKKIRLSQESSGDFKEGLQPTSVKRRENSKTKCISKAIKFFGNTKYLIIVNYIERPLEQNIRNISHDEVYEEFEILFEISAANLSKKNMKTIIWEISMAEALSLSYSRDIFDTAKFFIDHLNVFNEQFVISVSKFSDIYKVTDKKVIVLYEKVIIMLQRLFRNRKYKFNHQKFKEECENLKNYIIGKQIIRDVRTFYIFICVDKAAFLEVVAWDLFVFERVSLNIGREAFEADLKDNKFLLGEKLLKTMNIVIDTTNGSVAKKILFDQKACLEQLARAKRNPKRFLDRKASADTRTEYLKQPIPDLKSQKPSLSKKGSYFPPSPTKK